MNSMVERKLDTPFCNFWIEDGILFAKYAEQLEVDYPTAVTMVGDRLKFSAGVSYPALIDISGLKSISKAAREYMSKEGKELIIASALLVKNPLSKMLGNLFLRINKPDLPIRLHTDVIKAKKWLEQFKP